MDPVPMFLTGVLVAGVGGVTLPATCHRASGDHSAAEITQARRVFSNTLLQDISAEHLSSTYAVPLTVPLPKRCLRGLALLALDHPARMISGRDVVR
jgi:hypothetical protein